MASITIRNLDDDLKAQLRMEAARHGHSMEEEVRVILRHRFSGKPVGGLGSRIRERFSVAGGEELALPERRDAPRAPDLGE
ncbi:plasmid stability protein [Tamilnaduibacter salinus]|uniref:Plasmid stability protein n=1 Tax=Tamilnaduibacter salinus TaxID=1484056 RepID=A0A2U1CVD8_9GAMM|nr:plasmid stabilization protein [Tamilnaduibacter salinus]PVY75471.1 plasmid stability protein [Tamilnaduibacter salinus]